MMIRSAPAASAHLAEIPVPAPAPRMGVPRALLALHRSRHAARSIMLSPRANLAHEGTTRNIHDPSGAGSALSGIGTPLASQIGIVHLNTVLFTEASPGICSFQSRLEVRLK